MPGMITHYLCGELCLGRLQESEMGGVIKRHRQIYNLGTQGPDFFFFYIPCLIKPRLYRLGNVMHNSNVGQFFRSLFTNTMKLEGSERDAALSYICGYLTHYALDTNTHPYIYYRSGFKTEGDSRPSLHYSIMHRKFETNLDILMLKLATGKAPADKKLWQLINVDRRQAASTASVISGGLMDVYGIRLSHRQVYRAMSSMVMISRVLQSRSGRRKRLIGAVEGLLMPQKGYLTSLIHDQAADGGNDYLNLGGEPWYYPWDNPSLEETNRQHQAFTDMFEKSTDDAVALIEGFGRFVSGELEIDAFLQAIGNKSFTTGQDCSAKLDFLYHAAAHG